jgi:hypothetical protein
MNSIDLVILRQVEHQIAHDMAQWSNGTSVELLPGYKKSLVEMAHRLTSIGAVPQAMNLLCLNSPGFYSDELPGLMALDSEFCRKAIAVADAMVGNEIVDVSYSHPNRHEIQFGSGLGRA